MNTPLDKNWFTEVHEPAGSVYGLKITARLHDEQTPFQRIEIYETEQFGNLMAIDGFFMLTTRDNFLYHEMMSHPVLYTHPAPKRVVIIGGGDCGTLQAVLQHPEVEQAIQVEIDERVTRLSEKYFPELCSSNDDPRAELLFVDGLKWMKDAEPGTVDVVIVDSTDPVGPAEGLFTAAFFSDCFRVLGENGLLVQQSESPLLHLDTIIKPLQKAMRDGGFSQIHTLQFPQPCYPSGWWSATMAGKKDLNNFREQDAQNKPFATKYYNVDIHRAALAIPELMK